MYGRFMCSTTSVNSANVFRSEGHLVVLTYLVFDLVCFSSIAHSFRSKVLQKLL